MTSNIRIHKDPATGTWTITATLASLQKIPTLEQAMAEAVRFRPVTAIDILGEYGDACHHGRTKSGYETYEDMTEFMAALATYGTTILPHATAEALRDRLGLCVHGRGGWDEYCTDRCAAEVLTALTRERKP